MTEELWYYEDAGTQVGPVSRDVLAEAIRFGRLARGSRVWKAGMAGWQQWDSLPELAALAPPPPESGPPPLSAGAPPPLTPGFGAPPGSPRFPANSYAAEVLTGGAVALYPKAPLGNRFIAALLDTLISSVPAWILVMATIGASQVSGVLAFTVGIVAGVAVLWAIYYSFAKDGRPGGQSIGKKTMGLMVVHLPTNQPCSTGQSALRNLVLLGLNLIPYVGWLVEPVVTLAAAGGRRLGDSAAGTQVIAVGDYRPRP